MTESGTARPTAAEVEAARTPRGGWTRETLARWGVPWPPPPGWRKGLLGEPFDKAAYQREYMRQRRAAARKGGKYGRRQQEESPPERSLDEP